MAKTRPETIKVGKSYLTVSAFEGKTEDEVRKMYKSFNPVKVENIIAELNKLKVLKKKVIKGED